jgi:hypothetical protein
MPEQPPDAPCTQAGWFLAVAGEEYVDAELDAALSTLSDRQLAALIDGFGRIADPQPEPVAGLVLNMFSGGTLVISEEQWVFGPTLGNA